MKTRRILLLVLAVCLVVLLFSQQNKSPDTVGTFRLPAEDGISTVSNVARDLQSRAAETPGSSTSPLVTDSISGQSNAPGIFAADSLESATNPPSASQSSGKSLVVNPRPPRPPPTPPVPMPAKLSPDFVPVLAPATNRPYSGP